MKNRIFKIFSFLFIVSLMSCKKDDCQCSLTLYNTWEVTEFMSIESVLYAKDDNYNPTIEFKEDGELSIQLDANACFGEFTLSGNNGINIGNAGCTEMCCDSDFSLKFMEMLPQVDGYDIEDNIMKLNVPGWGWINLKLK